MKNHFRSIFLISIFIIFFGSFINASEFIHPGNLNIDLSNYARNISLTNDTDEGTYYCVINVKFKKIVPLKNDTITAFLKFASNFNCEKVKCELLIDEKSVSSGVLTNNSTKNKNFESSCLLTLDKDLGESNQIKLSFSGIEEKKPWIQLKEAKLPKEKTEKVEKAEKKEKTEKEPQVELKSKSEYEAEEEVKTESPKQKNKKEKKQKAEKEDSSDSKAETQTEITEKEQKDIKQTEEITATENKKETKKKNNGFLAWLKALFSKKNKKLPKDVQVYVENMEQNKDSLFINSVSRKKKLSQISGPFYTSEQVILVWIYKELPEENKFAVSKNDIYITDKPSVFFADSYKEVTEYLAAHGMEEAFKKYFSAKAETKKEETSVIEKDPDPPEITEEEIIPEEPEEVIEESLFFELPLNNDSKTSYSQYEKEYLQDYAPKKKLELPKETISERTIDNPDEADGFGRTLLMKAAQSGNNWEIKSLLASGANVNLKDNDGWTALMYAIRYQENISIVETLINEGAKIKVKNKYDLSPLILAASYNGNPEITKKILSYYSVSEKEVLQAFVLMLSDNSSSDFAKIAKIEEFLYKSIPLNTFYNGKTPLMYAAQYSDSTKILNCLMEAGAITSIRSTEGKTAFDYAQENKLLAHDDYFWALNRK